MMRIRLVAACLGLAISALLNTGWSQGVDNDVPQPPALDGDQPAVPGLPDDDLPTVPPLPGGGFDGTKLERLPEVTTEMQAMANAGNAYNRVYVEYNNILYPIQGFVEVDGFVQSTDNVSLGMEYDIGSRVALPDRRPRSDARFVESNGKSSGRADFLLPVPSDPNDVFVSQSDTSDIRLGNAWALDFMGLSATPEKDLLLRLGAMASFASQFDTGVAGGTRTIDVRTIALGSDPAAGQTIFTGGEFIDNVPLTLLFDNQMMNLGVPGLDEQQAQVYMEVNNETRTDQLRFEHLFVRMWNYEKLTIAAGQTRSLFGSNGKAPSSLNLNAKLIGTGELSDANRAQLRLQTSTDVGGGFSYGVAVEDPYDGDLMKPATGTTLNRWPTIAGNITYTDANGTYYSLAGLGRSAGFQDDLGAEHFATGWGLGAFTHIILADNPCNNSGLYFGASGGEGVGRYINGVGLGSAFDGTSLSALKAIGAYGGYTRRWVTHRGWTVGTNAAYGYSYLDTPAFVAADTNGILHQAWANIYAQPNDRVAFGLEYQYGLRETRDDRRGENNRFLFVLSLKSKQGAKAAPSYLNEFGRESGITNQDLGIYEGAAGTAYRQGL